MCELFSRYRSRASKRAQCESIFSPATGGTLMEGSYQRLVPDYSGYKERFVETVPAKRLLP